MLDSFRQVLGNEWRVDGRSKVVRFGQATRSSVAVVVV